MHSGKKINKFMIAYPDELDSFCVDGRVSMGGFISLDENFKTLDVVLMLQKKPEKRLRLGTSNELLLFWKQKSSHCPDCFVSLDFEENKFLVVSDGSSKIGTGSVWHKSFRVFVVEL